ncbi:amidohydrolase family protein [Streptosporangium roseum]|uniref:Aminocarboxymuconate-semialdehyde decarboxylase n=1 Tax=Streptosporangium roseum (strain ATCC 12428 / DSM 43021 / JCM 3005 / KCTC 9067 / NCIMB 10171 / NRRL 2505 / NI 9100) TaxID=479432 RepID=D2B538_STRRD|nr:amidohydrolase family protein [Streptosporangium roseum]ACZ87562.1 Aminocarboxymuconate-semialdehyde decarboxylase [Streptosporangium roseum DSM 43021]
MVEPSLRVDVEDGETRARTPVIDVHAHAMPMPLLRHLAREGRADLSSLAEHAIALDPQISGLAGWSRIPVPREQYDVASRLAAMDATGVDAQLVSAPPFVVGSMCEDPDLVIDVTRRVNDTLAQFVAGAPDRLFGLATVPVGHPDAARELARCLDQLGFAGASVGSFGGGAELDDPVNEELWGELSARRCFTLLHPSRASAAERLASYYLVQLLGYPVETALATARLILGGVLDRHDLVLCLAHGGGCVHGVGGRLNLGWRRKPAARTTPELPAAYLAGLYYDTAVFDNRALSRLIEDVTAGHVLLGTDMPFDLADEVPLETISELGMPPGDAEAILGGNVLKLLPIDIQPAARRLVG